MKPNNVRVLVLSLLLVSAMGAPLIYAKGVTKIAPTEAEPPHPFNIIDTAERRLVEGCVAVFRLNGIETVIPLDTHKPWNTAKGMLPADMGGGDYQVSVRQPDGAEFLVGMFKVLAPPVEPTEPTAADDAYIGDEDTALSIPAPGVLGNDADPEGDPLTAIKVTDPSHGTVTLNGDGSFTYSPAANYNGPDSFTYKASDGTLDSNVATVTITINPVNDAPTVANPIPDQEKNEAETWSLPLAGVFNDVDAGDSLTYTAILAGGDPLPSFLTLDAGTGSLYGSPDYVSAGEYDIMIIATDESGASIDDAFTLTVTNTNRAPEIVVTPDQPLYGVDENPAAALVITVAFSDPDGDTVTVQATQLPPFVMDSPTIPGTMSPVTLTIDPGCTDVGLYSIDLTAADDDPADPRSASRTLMIQVAQTNCPGTLSLSEDNPPLSMNENSVVNYKLALTDPEGDSIASVAIVRQQPDGSLAATAVKMGDDWYISLTADCNAAKQQASLDYTITVQALDTGEPAGALSNQLPVTVTVCNVNCPPVLEPIGDWTVNEGEVLEFTVSASDPDMEDTVLWFEAYDSETIVLPSGAIFIPDVTNTRRFVWTVGYDQAGTYHIVFVVEDRDPVSGLGLIDFEEVTITVNDVAHEYTLTVETSGGGQVTLEPPGGLYDAGTVVTMTAVADPGWVFTGWSGDLSGTDNPETITVDSEKTVTATFILPSNQPPIADADGPYITCITGDGTRLPTNLDASQSYDPNGFYDHIVSYDWDTDNDGLYGSDDDPDDPTGMIVVGFVDDRWRVGGIYIINLRVTDTYGAVGIDTSTIIIMSIVPPNVAVERPSAGESLRGASVVRFRVSQPQGKPIVISMYLNDDAIPFTGGDTVSTPSDGSWVSVERTIDTTSHPDAKDFYRLKIQAALEEDPSMYGVALSPPFTIDNTPPTITAPADITVEQTSPDGAIVGSLGTPTVSDTIDPNPTVTNDAPAVFPPGATTVTWAATDASGNTAQATQTVTVLDTTSPTITAPADITVQQNNPGGAIISSLGTPIVSDAVDPNPAVTNDAPIIFPVGVTPVTWTAVDASGNSATAIQYITVTPAQYTLTVNIVGSGTVTMDPDQTTYYYGDMVELTAVPDEGYMFTGWGGDLSGTVNPETIIMDSDKTVTATFPEGILLPYITPPIGEPGSPFTIYDPGGRMKPYDVVLFYPTGTDPSLGNLASNVVVSTDGRVLTGNVAGAASFGYHYVAVRPSINDPSEFNDLPFLVAGGNIVEPIIVPNRGAPGYQFIIYDPQGRMQQGDLAVFYLESTDPMLGNTAQNVVVSEDGKTMTGFVPGAAQRQTQQYVSVRPTLDAISRFNDLAFYVT